MIITIDGPAGSGKSTAARHLAEALGIAFLDTGATYRAVTLKALHQGADLTDEQALADLARSMDLHMAPSPGGLQITLDGEDVTDAIRTEDVSANARYAANAPAVREVLVALQRQVGRELGDFVTEGRDQGTVVFPHADVKFYLDADPAERARRRVEQLRQQGEQADVDTVRRAIVERDRSDRSRNVGPLRAADDAIVVDTTGQSQQQTLHELIAHVRERADG